MQNAEVQSTENPPDLRLRTYDFARRIVRLYAVASKEDDIARVLGKQLLRSGTSVGANYREATRARSKQEFNSILGICLKELEETSYWLDLLSDEQIVSSQRLEACAARPVS
jgi:four helix bundle protein